MSEPSAARRDGFAWLAALLPPPRPLLCPRCGRSMRLPQEVPLLWTCPDCEPPGAERDSL
ncbi:hypothetical protein [Streptomyces sp. CA-253872]|uniref:hypothetical protein n=1 Tax=Streptomyces sp. CA-253872 TaxID=3240067 RepID=UPI003D8BBD1E